MKRPLATYGIESRRMRLQLTMKEWNKVDELLSCDDRSTSDVVEHIIRNWLRGHPHLNNHLSTLDDEPRAHSLPEDPR